MAERIVPGPSLTPTAAPVDRFVAPVREEVGEDPMLQLARSLERINPKLQAAIKTRYDRYAATEEAEGQRAESYVDPSVALQKNREGWKSLIEQQRQIDRTRGTNHADKLAAASPHFKRGMLKARAQRLGMALNDHLASLYARNPQVEINGQVVNLHDVDDAQTLAAWLQQETNSYAERTGINQLDPLLVAEVFQPLAARAADSLTGMHTDLRLGRYRTEYMNEMSANAGLLLSYSGSGDSSVDDFIKRLGGRESGGDYSRVNTLGYTGLLQFGEERLADFNRAHGTSFTLEQFRNDPELQDKANRWHIEDIDRVIDENGYLAKGLSRDGLRAVAHLGGIGGMKKFVETNGGYNPQDAYKTSLMDYYKQFSGPAVDLQSMMDEAVADGMDPTAINKQIVGSVVSEALAKRDPAVLEVLMGVKAGSGPLGNIGWVKEEIRKTQASIQSAIVAEEKAQRQREEWQREDDKREIMSVAFGSLIEDPTTDISAYTQAALDSDNPELAKAITDFKETVMDRAYKVRTDPEIFTNLRYRVGSAAGDDELNQIMMDVVTFANARLLDKSDVGQLFDDIAQQRRNASSMRNPFVEDYRGRLGRTIRDRFAVNMGGLVKEGGFVQEQQAVAMFDVFMRDFMRENEGASESQLMEAADGFFNKIISMNRFAGADPFGDAGEVSNDPVPETPKPSANRVQLTEKMKQRLRSDPDLVSDFAEQNGMTVAEFIESSNLYKD